MRLLWEIRRLYAVLDRLEVSRQAIERVWYEEIGGQLVGMHEMKTTLANERYRIAAPLGDSES